MPTKLETSPSVSQEAKDAGSRVVAVVSAMGDTTDELIELAGRVANDPDRRELDVLLSTGELRSCALGGYVPGVIRTYRHQS